LTLFLLKSPQNQFCGLFKFKNSIQEIGKSSLKRELLEQIDAQRYPLQVKERVK